MSAHFILVTSLPSVSECTFGVLGIWSASLWADEDGKEREGQPSGGLGRSTPSCEDCRKAGRREMAQWEQCWLCKHGGLGSRSSTLMRSQASGGSVILGLEVETGGPQGVAA